MTNLKRRVASHKILQFLQNNRVIFFFQKKSLRSDHWRQLQKEIAKMGGVATLNIKNKPDKKEIQPLIKHFPLANLKVCTQNRPSPLFKMTSQTVSFQEKENSNISDQKRVHNRDQQQEEKEDRESENGFQMVERVCDLLYAPNLILGGDSLKELASLSHQLKEDENLIFIGGWDGNQLLNHLDSLKLLETPQEIWKEEFSCLSSSYVRPYLFFHSLLEKREKSVIDLLKEKMRALTRSLQERKAQQIKEP